ncbi:MAG: hypothetical protein WCB10_12025 [Steroidobacteraceae bacterium]
MEKELSRPELMRQARAYLQRYQDAKPFLRALRTQSTRPPTDESRAFVQRLKASLRQD